MIYLHYRRSGCQEVRIFRNYEEFNAWLDRQNDLAHLYPESETIKVTKIEERP